MWTAGMIVPTEYQSSSFLKDPEELGNLEHPVSGSSRRFVLGDRFHNTSKPHKSPLCLFHDIDLCMQSNTIKTSYQELENNHKNMKRLRSSTLQGFGLHFCFNYLWTSTRMRQSWSSNSTNSPSICRRVRNWCETSISDTLSLMSVGLLHFLVDFVLFNQKCELWHLRSQDVFNYCMTVVIIIIIRKCCSNFQRCHSNPLLLSLFKWHFKARPDIPFLAL